MTLATKIHIPTPCSERFAQGAFLQARRIIGIPAEHPFKRTTPALGWLDGEWIGSEPGGFRSALDVSHNHGNPLGVDCGEWCDHPCEYHLSQPVAFVCVRLDTAYGFRGPNDESCNDIHDEIVLALGEWLNEQGADWWAQNEYDGNWHHRSAPYEARVP